MEVNHNMFGKPKLGIGGIITRLIVYAFIWIACYHIIHCIISDWGNIDFLFATLWTGNIFFLHDFAKWLTNT